MPRSPRSTFAPRAKRQEQSRPLHFALRPLPLAVLALLVALCALPFVARARGESEPRASAGGASPLSNPPANAGGSDLSWLSYPHPYKNAPDIYSKILANRSTGTLSPLNTTYYSQGSLAPNLTASWNTLPGGGGSSPADFTGNGDVFIIQSGHNMSTTAAWSVSGGGATIQVGTGGTLTANNLVSVPNFIVTNGGNYVHNAFGSTPNGVGADLPGSSSRTFGSSSNVTFQKWANGGTPTALPSVAWGNITINVTNIVAAWQQSNNLATVNGTLTIQNTNGQLFSLAAGSSSTLTIAGDLVVSGGTLNLSSGAGVITLNLGGNYNQTSGIVQVSGSGIQSINFTGGAASATFTKTAGLLDTSGKINWSISSGKTVQFNNVFLFNMPRTFTVSSGGALVLAAGFFSGNTIINGELRLASGAFFNGNGPTYGSSALLKYESGTTYSRNNEWNATSGLGFPNDVQLSNNTTLDLGANGGTGTARSIGGSLAIDSGSTFQMAGTNAMTAPVTVTKDVTNNGTLTLSTASGGNLNVGGNFANGATGAFTSNGRTLTFNGGSTQTWSDSNSQNFGAVVLSGSGGVQLGSNIIVTDLTHTAGTLNLNGQNLNVAGNWSNSASLTPSTGTVTFNGNGNTQTLTGSTIFNNLTINHSGAGGVTAASSTLNVTGLTNILSGIFTSATQYGDVSIAPAGALSLSGPISVSGNWDNDGSPTGFASNGHAVTFNGTSTQTIGGDTTTLFTTLNISGTNVQLATTGDVTTTLHVTSGIFDINGQNLAHTGNVTVDAGTTFRDLGNSGTITMSGSMTNNGTVELNAHGASCPDADDILIRSEGGGQRTWSGSGTFNLTDVNVEDQSGTAIITVHNGFDNGGNGPNWFFLAGCTSNTYVWTPDNVACPTVLNNDWQCAGNWNPDRVTPDPGDVIIFDGGNGFTAPNVLNVPTQTIAALRLTNTGATPGDGVSVTLNTSAANTLTISGATGTDLSVPSTTSLTLNGSNALKLSLTGATPSTIDGQILLQGGAHRLLGANAGQVVFASGSSFTAGSGLTGNPFGTGGAGDGTNGAVVFQGSSTYSHNAGGSPFGDATHNVAVFQSASLARFFTASGFEANGRTYANLQIGKTDPGGIAVSASDSGSDNFTFNTLNINSPAGTNSMLTFTGSGSSTVTIRGNIISNGAGVGTIPDVILSGGTGGIVIAPQGGGPVAFTNDGSNSRAIDFESNATIDINTSVNLLRVLQMGLSADKTLTVNGNLTGGSTGYLIGFEQLNFTCISSCTRTFHVGTPNGYSPITEDFSVTVDDVYSQTIKAFQGQHPNITGANALQRYWSLTTPTGAGTATANVTFQYRAGDVVGTEANYKLFRYNAGFTQFTPDVLNTGSHFATKNGVTSFSDWTLAEPNAIYPDLTLTKTDSHDPATAENSLTYTITVTSNSTISASNVVITDTLPANVTFISASAGCSESLGTVTCNHGALAGGANTVKTITVTPTAAAAGTTLSNTASVTSTEPDANTLDNSDTETTAVVAGTCTSEPANLLSWYAAESNASDRKGVNNGSLQGGATFTSGRVGQAFSLDGIDDHVLINQSTSLNNIYAHTLDAWIKPTDFANGFQVIIAKENSGIDLHPFRLAVNGDGTINYSLMYNFPTFASLNSNSAVPANAWSFVAATFDGGTMRIYINGVLDASGPAPLPFLNGNSNPVTIGWDNQAGQGYFKGAIDETEIFTRTLSDAEILGIYNGGGAGKCVCTIPPLNMVSWYRAENNANDDRTVNNGTLQNGATFTAGKVGQAFDFDGVDDYVSLSPTTFDGFTDVTVDAWVRFDRLDHPSSDAQAIIAGMQGSLNRFTFVRLDTGELFLTIQRPFQSDCNFTSSPIALVTGRFYHLAVTKSGGTVKFYVDGAEVFSQSPACASGGLSNSNATLIGASNGSSAADPNRELDGAVDELEIFNRGLSGTEIANLYNAGSAGKCTNVNDAPVNTVPGAQVTNEDTDLTFSSGNGNQISTSDLDAGSAQVRMTLTATNGGVSCGNVGTLISNGVNFVQGDCNNDPQIILEGTLADMNLALNGMFFRPATDYNGAASVTVTVNDKGNTGIDPGYTGDANSEEDSDTVNITVNAVNDPTVTVTVSPTSVTEDGANNLDFTFARDDGTGTLQVNFNHSGTASFIGGDYTQTGASGYGVISGNVQFANGQLTKTVSINPTADTDVETDETVILTITDTVFYTVGSPNSAEGAITNDDAETNVAVDGSGNLILTDGNGGTSNDTLTISLISGPPRIRVTDPNNTLSCVAPATQFNANTCDVPQGSVTGNIQVNTLDGNDSLTLNFASGNFVPSGGLIYQGGGQSGSPGDSLTVTGGSNNTITHTFNNANDGSIQIDTINIQYTGLEPVTDNMAAVNRVFAFTGGAEIITLSDAAGAAMTIDSTLGEIVTFANPTGSLTINAGTGADAITIASVDAAYNVDLTINGDADSDTVNLNGDITFASGENLIVNAETVNTGASADLTTSGAGVITVTADDDALDATSTLVSASTVTLKPQTANRPINLGTETVGALSLTDAELDQVAAGALNIGDASSGAITVSGGIDLTDGPVIGTFNLVTGANVTETFAGTDLNVANLNITAPTGIGATGGGALDLPATTLTTNSTGSNGDQFINGEGIVTVGANDLNAGTGVITLYGGGRFNTVTGGSDILSNVVVASGGTLGGTGSVLSTKTTTVQSGGSVSPGTSPGILNTGNVSFNSGSTFSVEIGGTAPGNTVTDHDQLNVTGTVGLGNATLNLSSFGGFTPAAGDTFVIINNDSTDTIPDTFAGLAEGATITNFLGSGLNATITYQGGTNNNDVVLTAVSACTPPSTVYVDDSWVGTTPGTDPDAGGPATNFGCDSFATIQGGVDGVTNPGTVIVNEGTYAETVTVNKQLSVRGAQFGVDARTRAAVPESIVNGAGGSFILTANGIALDGFTMQDASTTTAAGIVTDVATSGYQIRNNIIKDNRIGLYLRSSGAVQTVVERNLIRDNNKTGGTNNGNGLFSDGTFPGLSNALIQNNRFAGSHTGAVNAQSVNLTNSNNLTVTANDFVDGSSLLLTNVDNSTFSNNTLTGSHTPSTFTGLRLGAGTDNMAVTGNSFLNRGTSAFSASQLDNLTFSNNVVTFDVSIVAVNSIRAIASFTGLRGTSSITGNSITLSGVMPSGAAVHGMEVAGNNTATVNVTQNTLNGGNTDSTIAAGHDSYGLGLSPAGFGLPNPVVTVVNATNNIITGWVDAVAFTFSGTAQPVGVRTTLSVNNNNLEGNLNKTLRAANTGATIDASANWHGSSTFATVQGRVSGSAVDYTPYLNVGTDTAVTAGFQGDFSSLTVHTAGAQFGVTARIQEGIGLVNSGGTVKVLPGTYSGNVDATVKSVVLAAGASPGQVTINGNFTLNSDDTLPIEIDGTSAATQYDNFIVNGSVALGSATLVISGTYTPAAADSFMIINNDGSGDAVVGIFNGLNEGTLVNVNGTNKKITYVGGDGNDVVLAALNADLSVAKTDSPDPVTEGNALTYTLTVSNAGPDPATNVVLTDTLPGSVTFVSATASQGSCSGTATVTCNLGTINNPGSATVQIVVIPNAAGTITNSASATSSENDVTPATDSEDTLVNAAVCTTPPSGMIDWYPADGNANDIAGTNHGTPTNGATFGAGKVNQGFDLDGSDDFVALTPGTFDGLTDLTVDAWVKFDRLDHPTSDAQAIISSLKSGTAHYFTLMKLDTGEIFVGLNTGGIGACEFTATPATPFQTGRFYHIAATKSGSTIKIYVDGNEILSQTSPCAAGAIAPNTTGTTRIGAADGATPTTSDRQLDGSVDELEIHNTALSATDIANIYNASLAGKCRTCTAPPVGMVSWWDGSGTGTTANDIGDSNSGTLQNTAAFAPGKVGQGFSFTNSGDQILVPHNANQNTGAQITVDAWINPANISTADASIINKRTAANVEGYTLELTNTGDGLDFEITTSGGVFTATAASLLTANVWQHVAATYDGTTIKVYVNGVQVGTAPANGAINSVTSDLVIGRNIFTGATFPGRIDEVELFNRALSATEIAAIANAGNAGKCHTSTIQFAQANTNDTETNSSSHLVNIVVTRDGASDSAVDVTYTVTDGTATTADSDYSISPASGTLHWNAGDSTPKNIPVTVNGDTKFEPDETVNLALSSPVGATLGTQTTSTLTIVNDDSQPTITINDLSQAEGSGGGATAFNFTVNLSNASSSNIDVNYSTQDNTAKQPSDYASASNTLTIPAGSTSGTITVQVVADDSLEPNETFFVNLTGATGATISDNLAIGTIQNDDAGPTFSIDNVSMSEGDSGTTNFVFTVTKTGPTGERSRVDFATANGTTNPATGGASCPGSDYVSQSGTLTFTPSETMKTITVAVCGDATYELNETFFVNLSNAVNASISTGQGVGTITNDDAAPTITIGDRPPSNEGTVTPPTTTPFSFTVTRTGSTAVASTVTWSTADGTTNPATGGGACGGSVDYLSVVGGIVTFPASGPGSTTQTLSVNVCRDATFELNETFFVNLTSATDATITDNQALGTIQNDDSPGATLVVNTTNDVTDAQGCDATHCSLREAINAANSSPSGITINFAIPDNDPGHFYYKDDSVANQVTNDGLGNHIGLATTNDAGLPADKDPDWQHGWWSIAPASALPPVVKPVVIDGYTQTDASVNSASSGDDAILRIEIDGTGAGANTNGLTFDSASGPSVVRGLAINRFLRDGSAATPLGNGLTVQGSNHAVRGNFIGSDISGTLDLGNGGSGIVASLGSSIVIGGSTPDSINLVSGNDRDGIQLNNTNGAQALGNLIGTKSNAADTLANGGSGINLSGGSAVFNVIGGPSAGEGNTIAHNGADGVRLADANFGNTVRGNSIFSNGATILDLGIDLGADGVTGNDALDGDSGPNGLQNFPIITLALKTSSTNTINGTLNSTAGETFKIDFYQSPACDDSGTHGEGKLYLGSIDTAATNGSGDVAFTFNPATLTVGEVITATATRINFPSETSEFSQCLTVVGAPEINVKGNSVSIVDGDNTPDPADHTDFGSASVVGATIVRTFTIENTGTAALNISSISISGAHSGDFTPGALTPAGPIAPGGSATFTVTFDPSAAGPRNAIVNVVSDDADESTYDFAILGTGGSQVSVNDAQAAEPASGTDQLLFVVSLTAPAAGPVSVDYATANDTGGANPATGGAACGGSVDYESTNGTVNFATGEQVKTVAVNICADGTSEPDETLLLNLTNPSNATIVDPQAVGTITQNSAPGTLVISELRAFGPGPSNDPADEFVEIYNNTDAAITVPAGGYGLFKMGADCDATPELVGTIPAGTVIPARGHFLFTGSAYSLNDYGGTNAAQGDASLAGDIEANRNLGLFSTTDVGAISTTNRLDAVGFGSNNDNLCALLREGPNQPALTTNLNLLGDHSYFRQICGFQVGCPTPGRPRDTNNNLEDFIFVDTMGTNTSAGQRLGAPGPENLSSPIKRDPQVNVVFLDATTTAINPPNRERDVTSDPGNASPFGTLTIRRRVVNQTGAPVTRLRFRIIDMTTFPPPPGNVADLRARTSSDQLVSSVNDPNTCAVESLSPPCTITVKGTTLEQPPTQPANVGGGMNSTMTVNLPAPLASGASVNVQFLLGVKQTGAFRFFLVVEALP